MTETTATDSKKITVYLVSCCSKKLQIRASACDLYVSVLFRKARQYAEASGCPWFILSAKHGLVRPNQQIEPYDQTLNEMGINDRRAWGKRVDDQLQKFIPELSRVVFLAGIRYREFLGQHLCARGVQVEVPMEGLRIGQQLSWLE